VRWFSSDIIKSTGQRIVQWRNNEVWLGKNERLFNTFGGANIKIRLLNAVYSHDNSSVDLVLAVTISDTYTFPAGPNDLRLYYEAYHAGYNLEENKDLALFKHSKTLIFTICNIKTGINQ